MRWEDLIQLSEKNPQMFDYIQNRSRQLLDNTSGARVLETGRGHLNPDRHIGNKLREGLMSTDLTSDGKYAQGRTGFLMKAKAGDMSTIGGRDVTKALTGKINVAKRRQISAYNRDFKDVMDSLVAGDEAGMDNIGARGAMMGMSQDGTVYDNVPAPSDVLSGFKQPSWSQGMAMKQDIPATPESMKNFAGDIMSGSMQNLPVNPQPLGDYVDSMKAQQISPRTSSGFITDFPVTSSIPVAQDTKPQVTSSPDAPIEAGGGFGGFMNMLFGGF